MKRFITVLTKYDVGHHSNWLPNMNPANFSNVAAPRISDNRGFSYQRLTEFVPNSQTPLARLYGTSLNSHLDSINILRGLDFTFRYGHGIAQHLGSIQRNPLHSSTDGMQRIPSIDYILSQNSRINPSRRRPVTIGQFTGEGDGLTVNNVASGQSPTNSFDQLYRELFSNVIEDNGGSITNSTPPHPRRDIMNRVMEDYRRLNNSSNISVEDRQTLTTAMDRFSDIFRRLPAATESETPIAGCRHSSYEGRPGRISNAYSRPMVGESIQNSQLLLDMMMAAIVCNVNNIFTVTLEVPFAAGDGNLPGLFSRSDFGNSDFHQYVSHSAWGQAPNGDFRWQWMGNHQSLIFSRFLGPLITALGETIDPTNGQSYLYNSLLHATWESSQVHSYRSTPVILAGNAGGTIRSGHYIDYSDRNRPLQGTDGGVLIGGGRPFDDNPNSDRFSNNFQGKHYNRLLTTILQAMGMNPDEYENRNLNSRYYNNNNIGSQNSGLTSIGGYGHVGNTINDDNNAPNIRGLNLRDYGQPLPMPT